MLKTKVSKNVPLNIPITTSPMDSVTEDRMAIEMARNGGLGFIHRYCTIEDQAKMVEKVKREENSIIFDPYVINPSSTLQEAREIAEELGVNTFLVSEMDDDVNTKGKGSKSPGKRSIKSNFLQGILTRRDMRAA